MAIRWMLGEGYPVYHGHFAPGDTTLKGWRCTDRLCVHNNGLDKCKTPLARPGQQTPVCGGRS